MKTIMSNLNVFHFDFINIKLRYLFKELALLDESFHNKTIFFLFTIIKNKCRIRFISFAINTVRSE